MIDYDKEWLIERFHDGQQLRQDREWAFKRAIEVWGYTKLSEALHRLLRQEPTSEWLPVWFHVHNIPDSEYEFGGGFYQSRSAMLLPLRGTPVLLKYKKVSPVTLERAVELWADARHVLRDATLRIRNINTGETIAWECFE